MMDNMFFNNLPYGSYTISEERQNGWNLTYPIDPNAYTVDISDNGEVFDNNNFAN